MSSVNNNDKIESSSDSDDDLEMNETIDESQLNELEQKIQANPLEYQNHITLISQLRQLGELERLRSARQNMKRFFPLAPNLWLDWIRDEISMDAGTNEVENLFKSAVSDYTSVDLWIEYVQWACGCGDMEKTRDIFEKAVVAVGLHVARGCLIWDAYREFEFALLTIYDPEISGQISSLSKEKFVKQKERMNKLFRRQLSLPLIGLENVYQEYVDFLNSQPIDPSVETSYRTALKQLELLKPFEDSLLSSTTPSDSVPNLDSYRKYLDFECAQKNPTRTVCLFERALVDHCLNVDLWLQYTNWLEKEYKIFNVILNAYHRAVANCPWASTLWRNYLLALERSSSPWEKIEEVFNQALEGGYSSIQEAADLWLQYCYQIRRKISSENCQDFLPLRTAFQRGEKFLKEKFGESDWDSNLTYRKNFARAEASLFRDSQAFRRLWDEIMAQGNGRFAGVWLEYLQIERQYGDVEHSRKLLYKSLNSASDFPEYIFAALIQFENEEGSLDDYDKACLRIEQQRMRINARKPKAHAPAKISPRKEIRKKNRPDPNPNMKFIDNKRKMIESQNSDSNSHESDGFALPTVPPMKKPKISPALTKTEPNPNSTTIEPISTKIGPISGPSTSKSVHDTSRYDRTVFVSNLDFKLTDDKLREIFSKMGSVAEVRLVMLRPNLSKGYGYIEFEDSSSIQEALKLDRHPIDGRPMYVSKCVDKSSGASSLTSNLRSTNGATDSQFRYGLGMEKNKLFVKNIAHEATEAALEEIFRPFGNLVSVRLVVHKSGMSKGLAYIEFADEVTAAKALLKTDGTFLLGRRLSVAVSNPPARRPAGGDSGHQAPLSASTKSFSTSLVPRSLTSKPKFGMETVAAAPAGESSGAKPKSNDEFRKMFMKN